jgi:hypothetical protein
MSTSDVKDLSVAAFLAKMAGGGADAGKLQALAAKAEELGIDLSAFKG